MTGSFNYNPKVGVNNGCQEQNITLYVKEC